MNRGIFGSSRFLGTDSLREELKPSLKCTIYSVENASICNELDTPNGSFISMSNVGCVLVINAPLLHRRNKSNNFKTLRFCVLLRSVVL